MFGILDPPGPKDEKKSERGKKVWGEKVWVEADDDIAKGDAMLFSVDTSSTPVDLAAVKTAGVENEEDDMSDNQLIPGRPNRATRRRIRLMEEQRERIRKKLGIPEGSQKHAAQVQQQLDMWITTRDRIDETRKLRKEIRTMKERARLRFRRGRILAGRILRNRENQIGEAGRGEA
ncbi:hypothetical protein F5B21DRAFT_462139 [Xylaria acuta]|nr:hypothetical protein F5B21DRAFT_462139 [Xylaria acuta]